MIYKELPADWQDLQQKVADIFSDSGYSDVEVEKKLMGVRGHAEIDVYAKNNKDIYLCECKNWNSAVPQSVVQTFRTIVQDIGANKGFIVSKKGFQSGARTAAENTNISLMDWYEFQSEMEDVWIENVGKYLYKYVSPIFRFTDTLVPKSLTEHLDEDGEKYFWELYNNYSHLWSMSDTFLSPMFDLSNQKERADECRKNFTLPMEIGIPMIGKKMTIDDYDSLRNYIIKYTDEGVSEFKKLTGKV
ncbi:MAG: hypothetical protein ACI9AR_000584 [Flavobacteriaceae bacterium]|jgi:hypothetical protein